MREEDLELPAFGAVRCRWAQTPWERARGLIGRPPPEPGTVMGFRRCNAIHTFFMGYPIDATFLDRDGRPVRTVRDIPPWRPLVWGGFRARSVLETCSRGLPTPMSPGR